MNIFVTNKCPIKSAKALDDKRIPKMVLESAQMLATAIHEHGGKATYKPAYRNHPATKWTRKNRANYIWLLRHFCALSREYTNRFGKKHKCSNYIKEFINGKKYIPNGHLTPFANCAANKEKGISYKHIKDTTVAYQLYLADRWETDKRIPTWYGGTR